jgi:hypothetical protein
LMPQTPRTRARRGVKILPANAARPRDRTLALHSMAHRSGGGRVGVQGIPSGEGGGGGPPGRKGGGGAPFSAAWPTTAACRNPEPGNPNPGTRNRGP